MTTPDNITELEPNEVFVFGSNLEGNHAGGAAATAERLFGAETGIGEGLCGQTYAFPTLGKQMEQLDGIDLQFARNRLFATARALPDKTFLLTKVGCGIAGFEEAEMKKLFVDAPDNIVKPENW